MAGLSDRQELLHELACVHEVMNTVIKPCCELSITASQSHKDIKLEKLKIQISQDTLTYEVQGGQD
jgi:hypothetical protein